MNPKLFYLSTILLTAFVLVAGSIQVQDEANYKLYKSPTSRALSSRKILDQELFSEDNLEAMRLLMHDIEEIGRAKPLTIVTQHLVVMRLQVLMYSDLLMHRYDNFQELRASGGPQVDHELCLKQLEHMIERAANVKRESINSYDINIHRVLDTFGRVPPNVHGGNTVWPGSYSDCISLGLEFQNSSQSMRYCSVSLKHPHWTQKGKLGEVLALKTAVCLPKTCDSQRHKNKHELVETLINLNDAEIPERGLKMSDVYCLPDEESSLSQWWKSPTTRIIGMIAASWICLLLCATIKYEEQESEMAAVESVEDDDDDDDRPRQPTSGNRLYGALAITKNLKSLLSTTSPRDVSETSSVNLKPIDGIKVICMMYIITGHVLMCLVLVLKNGREHFSSVSPAYYIPFLVPAFSVNSFFVITGILTSLIVFKQNQSFSFINSPAKWLALVIYRYLRIMPMYLITILYTKHFAKYLGSGPFWDYGTSGLASRRACEEESMLWVLLFGANFKSPFNHCIVSAWYLANDFQFFLVTPIFLALLHKYPNFGHRFMKLCIALGSLYNFYTIYDLDLDYRPIANFEMHGFKLQGTFILGPYTWPHCRIPSYLMGLLFGHALHTFNQTTEPNQEARWSRIFSKYGPKMSFILILICCIQPVICSRITFSRLTAKLAYAFLMPAGHLVFSWAVGSYILLAATGFGNKFVNRFLSASYWKPLSRLSLCVVLINVDVIQYFVQSKTELQNFNTQYQISMTFLAIVASYMVAVAMYVLFEAPIKSLLSLIISRFVSLQQTTRRKED